MQSSRSNGGGRGQVRRNQIQLGKSQARVFALTSQDAQASNAIMTSIIIVCSHDARVLYDPKSIHSYVFASFASWLNK